MTDFKSVTATSDNKKYIKQYNFLRITGECYGRAVENFTKLQY